MIKKKYAQILPLLTKKSSDLIIYDDENGDINFNQFIKIENFIKENLKRKCLILFIGDNDSTSIAHYLAFFRQGHCQIMLEKNVTDSNLKQINLKFKPEYIFISKDKPLINGYEILKTIGNYHLLKSNIINHSIIEKDLALLITTSGSTGESKFVKITFENLLENTISIIKYLNLTQKDIGISTLPISYSYGISVINSHLFNESNFVCNKNSFLEKNFWHSIKKYKVTNFSGVPFSFELLDRINFYNFDFHNVKFFTQAGGKLNSEIVKKICNQFMNKNINFFVMYGQTEASPRISYIELKDLIKKPESVGRPIPGGKITISKRNNGEVIYSGKNIYKGYANNRADLKKLLNIKKLKTGDLGFLDKEGFLFLKGRLDRDVKIYGRRINLDIIENYINNFKEKKYLCIKSNQNLYIIYVKSINETDMKKKIFNEFNIPLNIIKFKKLSKLPINKNNKISYSEILIDE